VIIGIIIVTTVATTAVLIIGVYIYLFIYMFIYITRPPPPPTEPMRPRQTARNARRDHWPTRSLAVIRDARTHLVYIDHD